MLDRSASLAVNGKPGQVKLDSRKSEVKYCGAIARACSHDDEIKACDSAVTSSPLCPSHISTTRASSANTIRNLATTLTAAFLANIVKSAPPVHKPTQHILTLYPITPAILYIMSLKLKVNGFHFRLATGLNFRKEEIKDIMALWLFSNRLRQGIYQSSLTGDNYKVLVSELRTHWDGAVGNFKRKAMGEGVKKDDTSQTLVVAKQVRNIVETYFTNNPKALKDAKTIPLHVYLNSVFIVESIFEVQNDHGRTFAKYVLSDSVQRVAVDDLFFTRHGESVVDLQTRDLKAALELEFAASKKQVLEIRRLKSELEVMDNMREQLERSKNDEQLALQETSECRKEIQALKHQIYGKDAQIEEQRKKVEELQQQLESLNAP